MSAERPMDGGSSERGAGRRALLCRMAATAAGAGLATGSLAQGGSPASGPTPEEGTNYVRLAQPLATGTPGRIEVIEFFWYGCPHCNAFEPVLDPWIRRQPADVAFRRVPVVFRERPFGAHQRLFYALEATNQLEKLHRRVFYSIHSERQPLADTDEVIAFIVRQGGDGEAFRAAWDSFGVQTRAQQARVLASAYRIDAVPAMGVAGRFYTSGALAAANGHASGPGANERMLVVVDHLVERVRRGA